MPADYFLDRKLSAGCHTREIRACVAAVEYGNLNFAAVDVNGDRFNLLQSTLNICDGAAGWFKDNRQGFSAGNSLQDFGPTVESEASV
jgi:hypothetical protein